MFPPKKAVVKEGHVEVPLEAGVYSCCGRSPCRVLSINIPSPESSLNFMSLLFSPDIRMLLYNCAILIQRNSLNFQSPGPG